MQNEAVVRSMHRTLFWACCIAALLAILPFLIGSLAAVRSGDWYAGFGQGFDDQMVYSAWMTQAQDGRLLMDNRFAVDPQPGLTIQLYFFALGLLSKFLGIPLAMALARAATAALFVCVLYKFLRRLSDDTYFLKLGLCLGVFGGGFGFAVWHDFGREFTKGGFGPLNGLLFGRLPIDVWQPEAFVFPSMLTNSLFTASLCLILVIFSCLIDARKSWKPVPIGALCMLLLMNIHSYDVLLIALVATGFLVVELIERRMSFAWFARGLVIGLGALPSAAWFLYVLKNDAVFQARAATPTFAPNFKQVLAGLLLLIGCAAVHALKPLPEEAQRKKWMFGAFAAALLLGALFLAASNAPDDFWMTLPVWVAVMLAALLAAVMLSRQSPVLNLLQVWALVGVVAIYFPSLFQRKLAMGMALPWSILAALGIYALARTKDKSVRTFGGGTVVVLLCLTSARWLLREREYIISNVASTTVQPVIFQPEVKRILQVLRDIPGRKVVLAMPGIALAKLTEDGVVPDSFQSPFLPDLNPLASGFSGAYSYAGHWSETPDYQARRIASTAFFLGTTPPEQRETILQNSGATYLIAPVPDAFPDFFSVTGKPLFDARSLGKPLAGGTQFVLLELKKAR